MTIEAVTWLKAIIKFIKPGLVSSLSVSILYIFFLFAPVPEAILVDVKKIGVWVHIVGLFCIIFSVIEMGKFAFEKLSKYLKKNKIVKYRKKYLETLSEEEKSILREFICNGTKTVALRYNDGTHYGLEYNKIIYRASNMGHVGSIHPLFDYNIQPWAWEFLLENKHLIE
jgi:hypothetical protein